MSSGLVSGILSEKAGIDAIGPEPRSTFVPICDLQVAGRNLVFSRTLADGKGFEPLRRLRRPPVFKTA